MTQSLIAAHVDKADIVRVRDAVRDLPDGSALAIMLENLLQAVLDGEDVTVFTAEKDLTTSQAAKLLNVSRPFVTKLMTEGLLASHYVGSHRRCTLSDIQDYVERRERAAADLARVSGAPAAVRERFMGLAGATGPEVDAELEALGFPATS
ncbi:MAG: helix-turn-helix domain-containing protein [Propionibacteriaceae bacterium]|nr:helix-turn-helix domain-containing protein [Propionibacteriaceae bacterium]